MKGSEAFESLIANEAVDIADYLSEKPGYTMLEHAAILVLSEDNEILAENIWTDGCNNFVSLPTIDMVLEACNTFNSNRIVISHSHGYGKGYPSLQDVIYTASLKKDLAPFQIEVVDHVIVTPEAFFSMKEWLTKEKDY